VPGNRHTRCGRFLSRLCDRLQEPKRFVRKGMTMPSCAGIAVCGFCKRQPMPVSKKKTLLLRRWMRRRD